MLSTYVIMIVNYKENRGIFLAPNIQNGYTRNVDEAMSITFDNIEDNAKGIQYSYRSAIQEFLSGAVEKLSRCYFNRNMQSIMAQCLNNPCPKPVYFWQAVPKEIAQDKLDKDFPLPRKAISKKTRLEVYNKFQGHCAYCGKEITLAEMQVDHFLAHMGCKGIDEIDNYMPACRDCNMWKSNLTLERFRDSIIDSALDIYIRRKKPCNWLADRIVRLYKLENLDYAKNHKIVFFYEMNSERNEKWNLTKKV